MSDRNTRHCRYIKEARNNFAFLQTNKHILSLDTVGVKIRSPKSIFVSEKKLVVCLQMLAINLTKSNEHYVFEATLISCSRMHSSLIG